MGVRSTYAPKNIATKCDFSQRWDRVKSCQPSTFWSVCGLYTVCPGQPSHDERSAINYTLLQPCQMIDIICVDALFPRHFIDFWLLVSKQPRLASKKMRAQGQKQSNAELLPGEAQR